MTIHECDNTTHGDGFAIVWRDPDGDGADLIDVLAACRGRAEDPNEESVRQIRSDVLAGLNYVIRLFDQRRLDHTTASRHPTDYSKTTST